MDSTTPKNYSPKKTKAIFDAAKKQFLQHGFKGATMDGIALEAGVSKQTLYNRYPDKQALFIAILHEMIAHITQETDKSLPVITSAEELEVILHTIGGEVVQTIANPEYLQFMRIVIPEFHNHPQLKAYFRSKMPDRIIGLLTQLFTHAMKTGIIRTVDPELLARMFAGVLLTYILQRGVLGELSEVVVNDNDIRDLVHTILEMVRVDS